jgi:hypothetical protein
VDLSGTQVAAEPLGMMATYLKAPRHPHVLIEQGSPGRFTGMYQFGAQEGSIDDRVKEVREGGASLAFTFTATDEMDEASGRAQADFAFVGKWTSR